MLENVVFKMYTSGRVARLIGQLRTHVCGRAHVTGAWPRNHKSKHGVEPAHGHSAPTQGDVFIFN